MYVCGKMFFSVVNLHSCSWTIKLSLRDNFSEAKLYRVIDKSNRKKKSVHRHVCRTFSSKLRKWYRYIQYNLSSHSLVVKFLEAV